MNRYSSLFKVNSNSFNIEQGIYFQLANHFRPKEGNPIDVEVTRNYLTLISKVSESELLRDIRNHCYTGTLGLTPLTMFDEKFNKPKNFYYRLIIIKNKIKGSELVEFPQYLSSSDDIKSFDRFVEDSKLPYALPYTLRALSSKHFIGKKFF